MTVMNFLTQSEGYYGGRGRQREITGGVEHRRGGGGEFRPSLLVRLLYNVYEIPHAGRGKDS